MKALGIDIGTSSICAALIDAHTGERCQSITLENTSKIQAEAPWERVQDPWVILEICRGIQEHFCEANEDICAIGVTGQMHGILYINDQGEAVSPLYTWQDDRGNLPYKDGLSYAQYLQKTSGYSLATGFGMVTHFYNQINNLVDETACCFCSVPDFVAMSLGREKQVRVHPSMAASFGLYDLKNGCFDLDALRAANINCGFAPPVAAGEKGSYYKNGPLPVALALGDNQASFLGAVGADSKLLINIGTGSQLSAFTQELFTPKIGECRPYINNSYLYVGSPLCGGYAYSLLHDFFRETQKMLSDDLAEIDIYDKMNKAAEQAYDLENHGLLVNTQFKGTRQNPEKRGGIFNLTEGNFHPGFFSLGVLKGICGELHEFMKELPSSEAVGTSLVGSGNGFRKNPVLQRIAADKFGCEVKIPRYAEEASVGSALFALYCTGYYEEPQQLQALIKYE